MYKNAFRRRESPSVSDSVNSDIVNFDTKRSVPKEILSEVEVSIVKMIVIMRDDCNEKIICMIMKTRVIILKIMNQMKQKQRRRNEPHQTSLCLRAFRGERGGSVVECRTPEREVRGSRPTAAVLCP